VYKFTYLLTYLLTYEILFTMVIGMFLQFKAETSFVGHLLHSVHGFIHFQSWH